MVSTLGAVASGFVIPGFALLGAVTAPVGAYLYASGTADEREADRIENGWRGDTSRDLRRGMRGLVEAGFVPGTGAAGGGAGFGWALDRRQLLRLGYTQISRSNNDDDFSSSNEQRLLDILYERYLGNSFYVAAGLAWRDGSGEVRNKAGLELYRVGFQDVGLEAAIGNRWQWRKWSLALEYVRGYARAFTFSDREHATVAPTEKQKAEIANQRSPRRQTGFVLALYAGLAL